MITEQLLPANCYSSKALVPRGLVIHYISAVGIDKERMFDLDLIRSIFIDYKVSAHYLITREGSIVRLVSEQQRAYHAGKSMWNGEKHCNNWMLGVELVATHTSGFTDEQYIACAELCARMMSDYQIEMDDVVGHEDVAPKRKIDPGPEFDWVKFRSLISAVDVDEVCNRLI